MRDEGCGSGIAGSGTGPRSRRLGFRIPHPSSLPGDPPRSPTVFSGKAYSHQKSRIWESSRRFSRVQNNFTVCAPRSAGGIW